MQAQRFKDAILGSWAEAAGLRFSGWGTCSSNANGILTLWVVDTLPGAAGRATVGYDANQLNWVNVLPNQLDTVAIHEIGHSLSFNHEMARQAPTGCQLDPAVIGGNTLGTVPDRDSVMNLGYCNGARRLSYWDRIGVQRAYGLPNYFADINGDGTADSIIVNPGSVRVALASAQGQFGIPTTATQSAFYGNKGTFYADVDGDHRADAIAVTDSGVWVRQFDGTVLTPWLHWWALGQPYTDALPASPFFGNIETFFADTTGDGRADLIALNEDGVVVRASTGSVFNTPLAWSTGPFQGTGGNAMADVNGDGRSDLVAFNLSGSAAGAWVRLSTGSSFAAPINWLTTDLSANIATRLADVSGDGLADLVTVETDGIWVRASTGGAFAPTASNWTGSRFVGDRGTFFVNIDNVPGADVVAVFDGGWVARKSTGTGFGAPSTVSFPAPPYTAVRDLPACVDGIKNGDESDLDCGGSCVPCAIGKECNNSHTDCADGICVNRVCTALPVCYGQSGCAPSNCDDGLKNREETDIDCGGAPVPFDPYSGSCPRCAQGRICTQNSDCASTYCNTANHVCGPTPMCKDGVQDAGETGIDCGGPCGRCPGAACGVASDCVSKVCTDGVCIAASCSDGVFNGQETYIDCGGATSCPRCSFGDSCHVGSDCQSGVCHAICLSPPG